MTPLPMWVWIPVVVAIGAFLYRLLMLHYERVDERERIHNEKLRSIMDDSLRKQVKAEIILHAEADKAKRDSQEKNRRLNDPSYLERRVREARVKPPTD